MGGREREREREILRAEKKRIASGWLRLSRITILNSLFKRPFPQLGLSSHSLEHLVDIEARSQEQKAAREKKGAAEKIEAFSSMNPKQILLDVREPEQERHQLGRDVSHGAEAVEQGGMTASSSRRRSRAADSCGRARRGLGERRDGDHSTTSSGGSGDEHLAARCRGRQWSLCKGSRPPVHSQRRWRRRRGRSKEHDGGERETVDPRRRGKGETKGKESG